MIEQFLRTTITEKNVWSTCRWVNVTGYYLPLWLLILLSAVFKYSLSGCIFFFLESHNASSVIFYVIFSWSSLWSCIVAQWATVKVPQTSVITLSLNHWPGPGCKSLLVQNSTCGLTGVETVELVLNSTVAFQCCFIMIYKLLPLPPCLEELADINNIDSD